MSSMFEQAQAFVGTGVEKWNTGTLASLHRSFLGAHKMNANVGGWDVSKVTDLRFAFDNAYAFEGNGVEKWVITNVKAMGMFTAATSLTSCNKRKIADAWKTKVVFTDTSYDTDWANDACPPLTDAQFKRASWGTSCDFGLHTCSRAQLRIHTASSVPCASVRICIRS